MTRHNPVIPDTPDLANELTGRIAGSLPWGDMPYDERTPAEVVHDYVVIRGDLSEQYARDQLALWIDRYAAAYAASRVAAVTAERDEATAAVKRVEALIVESEQAAAAMRESRDTLAPSHEHWGDWNSLALRLDAEARRYRAALAPASTSEEEA